MKVPANTAMSWHLNKSIIGMIHVQALPGTPKHQFSLEEIIAMAVAEAKVYQDAGVHAIMIENMHDLPYIKNPVPYEVVASMTAVAAAVVNTVDIPIGIQILAGGNEAALAVAKATGLSFIRAEGFVFGHLGDEGYMDACAGPLLRYRKTIGAQDIMVFTDIKKKHSSHAITKDISLAETVTAAEFFLSDGIVLTGRHTALPVSIEDLQAVCEIINVPLILGSGVNNENLKSFYLLADAFIIGSHFKKAGKWGLELDSNRIEDFMRTWRSLSAI